MARISLFRGPSALWRAMTRIETRMTSLEGELGGALARRLA